MKMIIASIVVVLILVGGPIFFLRANNAESDQNTNTAQENNVSSIGAAQVITINAKGGYSPSFTLAKANTKTTLKVKTKGTFDCSSAVSIPALRIRKNLPPSGETDIEIPPQQAGTTLQGLCSMGMYYFTIAFQ